MKNPLSILRGLPEFLPFRRAATTATGNEKSPRETAPQGYVDDLGRQLAERKFMSSYMPISEYLGEKAVNRIGLVQGTLASTDSSGLEGFIVSRMRSNSSGMDVVAVTYPPDFKTTADVKIGVLDYGARTVPFVSEVSLKDYVENAAAASFVVSLIGRFGEKDPASPPTQRLKGLAAN